jgi:glycosyltransferase involved in cell wall biosynthesis
VNWFDLDPRVEQLIVPDVRQENIPDADVVIATAWTTAPWVASYGPEKGRGFYLIQHYEAWDGLEEAVDSTWRLPLHKIVIAKWLQAKADIFGQNVDTTYIPNGLDLERFSLIKPIESRAKRVLMLAHKASWKGTEDGVRALEIMHGILPSASVVLFGTDLRADNLPDWIDYERLPSPERLTSLYNDSAIFLHPSWSEGLPAPPAEAMACGCAVVAAANDGVLDYVEDSVTGLTAPIKHPEQLAEQLLRLLQDETLRVQLASAGYRSIQKYTWTAAEDALENLLSSGHTADKVIG